MELKKLQQQWNSFPETSMEERPILSSDLEKIVVKNPLSNAFYLRKKLLTRIAVFSVVWLVNTWLLRIQWLGEGNDLYLQSAFFLLLSYAIYFHLRLLLFADYPTLLALPLIPFLSKLEIIIDKYIISHKLVSAVIAFGLLVLFEQLVARLDPPAYESFSRNIWYKWLLIIFMAVSLDILLLNMVIPRYRKLLGTVRKYKEGILARAR
jgi:hypothetical protein